MKELEDLQKDLTEATENLSKLGRQLKASAKAEAELHAHYEMLKNGYLIEMYAQEVDKATKRTVDQRTAMYRLRYKDDRLRWMLAKADFETDRDLFKALATKISALQTLIGLEKEKMKL